MNNKYIIKTRLNRVFSSQWLNRVSRGNALSAQLFRMHISRQWLCLEAIWLLNQVAQQIFSEQEKLLLAELGRDFPEVESKGYDSKTLAKKTKASEEILTKFNSQNLNGIKSDLSQLQGCWRRLKLRSKKEHDLHRREARKTGMHQIGLFSSASVVPQVNLLSCVARRPLFNKVSRGCEARRRLFVTGLNSMIYIIYILLPCFCIIFPRFFWFSI